MSGTDIQRFYVMSSISLWRAYGMSGTDLGCCQTLRPGTFEDQMLEIAVDILVCDPRCWHRSCYAMSGMHGACDAMSGADARVSLTIECMLGNVRYADMGAGTDVAYGATRVAQRCTTWATSRSSGTVLN
eukprot:1741518-Rhodomonas_salina.2